MEKQRNAHIFFIVPNASIGKRAMTWKKIASFFHDDLRRDRKGNDVRRGACSTALRTMHAPDAMRCDVDALRSTMRSLTASEAYAFFRRIL